MNLLPLPLPHYLKRNKIAVKVTMKRAEVENRGTSAFSWKM